MLRVLVVTTPITPSRSFSVETLTGLIPLWKTKLNRSISIMEDGIPGGLQHRHKTCCEKGGPRGRQACMVRKWFHHGDVVSRQVDLYMTNWNSIEFSYVNPIQGFLFNLSLSFKL